MLTFAEQDAAGVPAGQRHSALADGGRAVQLRHTGTEGRRHARLAVGRRRCVSSGGRARFVRKGRLPARMTEWVGMVV